MAASQLGPYRKCRAVKNKFTPYENDQLISHVRNFKCLYDKNDAGFNNHEDRARAWKTIASLIGGHPKKAVADCKNQWQNLRNVYQKKLRSVITEPDSGAAQRAILWPFYEALAFLNDAAGLTRSLGFSDVDLGLPESLGNNPEEDLEYIRRRSESPVSEEYRPPKETANVYSDSTLPELPQFRNSGLEKRSAYIPVSANHSKPRPCTAAQTATEVYTKDLIGHSGNTLISAAQEQTFLNYVAASIADTSPEHKPKLLQEIKRAILTVQLEVLEH